MYRLHSREFYLIALIFIQKLPLNWFHGAWVLYKKPPVAQLLKNFLTFYGIRNFITVFTRVFHWSLPWARWIQSILFLHLNIILPPTWPLPVWLSHHYMHTSSLSLYLLHTPPISSSLTKKTPRLQSASELYRPSYRRLSAKLMPTLAGRVCRMVSATDPHCR
jgi:hypothetical protein